MISPDDRYAAVSMRPRTGPAVTLVIDLPAQRTIATLVRPALFWAGKSVVVGPRAGCAAACDFALADPVTGAETPVGQGFGDGTNVVASRDGSHFATVVASGGTSALVVWSTAGWSEVGRVALLPAPVAEIGFNATGTTAFARQETTRPVGRDAAGRAALIAPRSPSRVIRMTAYDIAAARGLPPVDLAVLPEGTAIFETDLDHQRVMTSLGSIAFGTTALRTMRGRVGAYTSDPRYGSVFAFDSGMSALIGGVPAANKDFPWQVELQYWQPPTSHLGAAILHNCGGSLIRPGWVLTATHCFLTADEVLRSDEEARKHTVVRAGSTDLDGDMATFDVTEVYIRRCTERPAAECFHDADPAARPPSTPLNDIALLRIVPHVNTVPVQPRSNTTLPPRPGAMSAIDLPRAGADPAVAVPVTLTGWGATSASNASLHIMSSRLNRIDIAVVARDVCTARNGIAALGTSVICAGAADDSRLACKGDSGGPLVTGIDHKPVLVGIVSWGNCHGGPAVYTRVAAFVPWIEATIAAAERRRPSSRDDASPERRR